MNCNKQKASAQEAKKEFTKYLLWEKQSRDTIDVKRVYIDMAGDLMSGVLLSQIMYWYGLDSNGKIRLRVKKDGFLWLAKNREDWWDECRLTPKQYDKSIKILQNRGLVKVRLSGFAGKPTPFIRINPGNFVKLLNRYETNLLEGYSKNSKNVFNDLVKSNTENTNNNYNKTPEKSGDVCTNESEILSSQLFESNELVYLYPENKSNRCVADEYNMYSDKPKTKMKVASGLQVYNSFTDKFEDRLDSLIKEDMHWNDVQASSEYQQVAKFYPIEAVKALESFMKAYRANMGTQHRGLSKKEIKIALDYFEEAVEWVDDEFEVNEMNDNFFKVQRGNGDIAMLLANDKWYRHIEARNR